jgi:transposase-like protein
MLKEHTSPLTLADVMRYSADPDRAMAFVIQLRWPSGVVCPRCDTDKPNYLKSRRIWRCKGCGKDFSVKVGTIFEDSPLGLDKWLPAIWLLANAKNGISSYELHRALGVTQKTAWFMLGRIRLAMQARSFDTQMGGKGEHVEVDETFVGGLGRNMHKSKRARLKGTGTVDKVAVMGLLQRKRGKKHSTIRAEVVPSTKARELEPRVVKHVAKRTNVYTDKFNSYSRLKERDFQHAAIDHAVKYVEGDVHTNGLENFWSLLKRSIKGTYIAVDPIHLFRYVDEQVYRFNERKKNDLQRFVGVLKDVVSKRLTYSELISSGMLPTTT